MYTAYVTGGSVFAICKRIQSNTGDFTPADLVKFNNMTEGRYGATAILGHRASYGQVYRIEYIRGADAMSCH